jgi:hypothetical protein
MAFLAKPMFKINKPLLISEQIMDVMWQNILWLVREYLIYHKIFHVVIKYFATSLKNIHVADEYIKNIP